MCTRLIPLLLVVAVTLAFPFRVGAQRICSNSLGITRVALWDATRTVNAIQGTTDVGGVCHYYIESNQDLKDFTLEIEFSSAVEPAQTQLELGVGTLQIGDMLRTSARAFEQRISLLNDSTAAYMLTLRIKPDGRPSAEQGIHFYYAHVPRIAFLLPTTGCGEKPSCILQNTRNLVQINGENLHEIDDGQVAADTDGNQLPIKRAEGKLYLEITPNTAGVYAKDLKLPLRRPVWASPRVSNENIQLEAMWHTRLNSDVVAREQDVRLFALNTDSALRRLFTESVLAVRVKGADLPNNTTYQLVADPDNNNPASLAVLRTYNTVAGFPVARVHVSASAGSEQSLANTPILYLMQGDSVLAPVAIAVLPRPRIERIETSRGGLLTSETFIYPADTARMYFYGPSVGAFTEFEAKDPRVKVRSLEEGTNRIVLSITTPREEVPFHEITLRTPEGVDTTLRFEIRPRQRPRRLDFANAYWNAGNAGGTPLAQTDRQLELSSFEGVRLGFQTNEIDSLALYGVQYLTLRAKLVDHRGTVVDSAVKKIAVVPSNSFNYSVLPEYVATTELDLDQILSNATLHTKPHSRLALSLQHEKERYTEPVPTPWEMTLIDEGVVVVEPRITLPSGLYVVGDGIKPDLVSMLTGAFLDVTIFPFRNSAKPSPLSGQIGAMVVETNFLSETERSGAQVVPAALLNYTIATVRRNLTFNLAAGTMYLDRKNNREEWFLLLSPGLSLSVR